MKFSTIAVALGSAFATVASAFENIRSPDYQFNVTSPLVNGTYITGYILPYSFIPTSPTGVKLNLYLRSVNGFKNETIVANDVSSSSFVYPITVDGKVYNQFSVNYRIPNTTIPGPYEAVFQNVNTNINTTIPIVISHPIFNTTSTASNRTTLIIL
ncbi:uncharacterized protein BX663DRAFT_513635 [Cokeromyces recurvatus]|uniref:uncharacterized protein n=1 Tax=Cokeromyces recurvatus TaxID=90255 RepID=UPI00221FF904|nr:uncharacterized protein BX663DRAFT_513635 [Cokeromyces recurvatus]KAI7901669.1 hypothetical protein BX663DRAFT_513635 [Cokeromyces recurvatus]